MTPLNPRGRSTPSLIVIIALPFRFVTGLLQHRLLNWHLECLLRVEVCSSTNTQFWSVADNSYQSITGLPSQQENMVVFVVSSLVFGTPLPGFSVLPPCPLS